VKEAVNSEQIREDFLK